MGFIIRMGNPITITTQYDFDGQTHFSFEYNGLLHSAYKCLFRISKKNQQHVRKVSHCVCNTGLHAGNLPTRGHSWISVHINALLTQKKAALRQEMEHLS